MIMSVTIIMIECEDISSLFFIFFIVFKNHLLLYLFICYYILYKFEYYFFILLYLLSFYHYFVSFPGERQNLHPLIAYLHGWAPLMCAFTGGCSVLSLFLSLSISSLSPLYISWWYQNAYVRMSGYRMRFSFVRNRFSRRA